MNSLTPTEIGKIIERTNMQVISSYDGGNTCLITADIPAAIRLAYEQGYLQGVYDTEQMWEEVAASEEIA